MYRNDYYFLTISKHAMDVMGMNKGEQLSILSIVGAVLHLGNMLFIDGRQQAEFKDKRSKYFSLDYPLYCGILVETLSNHFCMFIREDKNNVLENNTF